MSFEIIELSGDKVVSRRSLQLAGHNFIYDAWLHIGSPRNGWVVQEALVSKRLRIMLQTDNDLRLLITTSNYSYFVEEIWGWTYKANHEVDWTPLLFVGVKVTQESDCVRVSGDHLYQFMYLQGGDAGWIFGAGGPNTSPLLFDDSFAWFRRAIK